MGTTRSRTTHIGSTYRISVSPELLECRCIFCQTLHQVSSCTMKFHEELRRIPDENSDYSWLQILKIPACQDMIHMCHSAVLH